MVQKKTIFLLKSESFLLNRGLSLFLKIARCEWSNIFKKQMILSITQKVPAVLLLKSGCQYNYQR